MLRILLCVCLVGRAVSIIVTDYPPTSTEYNYSYNVVNPSTGDAKILHEMRHGNVVTGSYSLIDPDGTRRTVNYVAGPGTGFNAVVHREPANSQVASNNAQSYPATGTTTRPTPVPYLLKNPPSGSYLPVPRRTNRVYFSPGDRVTPDKPTFNQGEYFVAEKAYHTNRI